MKISSFHGTENRQRIGGVSCSQVGYTLYFHYIYSLRSFQPILFAGDKPIRRRQPGSRGMSQLYHSVILVYDVTYKFRTTSMSPSLRAQQTQSKIRLKGLIHIETIQSSQWITTHQSTHPLTNFRIVPLQSLLNPHCLLVHTRIRRSLLG